MSDRKTWYLASWTPLAWFETGIKIVAFISAYTVLFQALQSHSYRLPVGQQLFVFIIQIILSIGLTAAIIDRLLEREITAMIFLVLNILAHWGIVLGLISNITITTPFFLFWILMLLGDLVKIAFLKTNNFKVRDIPSVILYGLTIFYVIGYAAILVSFLV